MKGISPFMTFLWLVLLTSCIGAVIYVWVLDLGQDQEYTYSWECVEWDEQIRGEWIENCCIENLNEKHIKFYSDSDEIIISVNYIITEPMKAYSGNLVCFEEIGDKWIGLGSIDANTCRNTEKYDEVCTKEIYIREAI